MNAGFYLILIPRGPPFRRSRKRFLTVLRPGIIISSHRILASVQVSEDEYKRITTPAPEQDVKYLFFPGCNVYRQPEIILNALDIMTTIGDPYPFLPGLDYCCGDNHLFFGRQEEGSCVADEFIAKAARYNPEAVILWCPTCHCRFNTVISPSTDVPFRIMSFPQYLSKNMKKLPLADAAQGKTLTLHDPCKSAYTGADQMVTVCHYCNQTFASKERNYDFEVVNYVNLVAESMGIYREDKFKRYAQWNDLELILKDIGSNIEHLPFGKEKMLKTLRSEFIQ